MSSNAIYLGAQITVKRDATVQRVVRVVHPHREATLLREEQQPVVWRDGVFAPRLTVRELRPEVIVATPPNEGVKHVYYVRYADARLVR